MKPTLRALPPLPVRSGISPSFVVLPAGPWLTIFDFLQHRFPQIPRASWLKKSAAGDVLDSLGQAVTPQRTYQAGLRVFYYRELSKEKPLPVEAQVLFQDEWLVVADKPHFLPVVPGGKYLRETLLVRLRQQLGIDTLTPLHRIDRETAGVVVFSVQPATRGRYQSLFEQRQVSKVYEAIAPYRSDLMLPKVYRSRMVESDFFHKMHEIEGEPNAQTQIVLLEQRGPLAKYQLRPETGRKHQLRLHCAALGIPILNDTLYPHLYPEGSDQLGQPLQLLARSIEFVDPLTAELRQFKSQRNLQW